MAHQIICIFVVNQVLNYCASHQSTLLLTNELASGFNDRINIITVHLQIVNCQCFFEKKSIFSKKW